MYETELDTGKGPRLFIPVGTLIAPDLLVLRDSIVYWIEAKHKTAFTWHRNTSCWTTGIDLRHYNDYLSVANATPFPVWLLFLQRGGHAKDSPLESPAGLYGNALDILQRCENHRSDRWGSGGMVYWSIRSLRKLADISDFTGL